MLFQNIIIKEERNMKKTIALILTVVMLMACVPTVIVSATPTAYNGTPDESWYTDEVKESKTVTLTTAEQLAGLASLVNNGTTFEGYTIKLGADIVINDYTKAELEAYAVDGTIPAGKSAPTTWIPIGNGSAHFYGVFNGQGHTIKGAYSSSTESGHHNLGIFGSIASGAIQNLIVTDTYFCGDLNIGGVVGMMGVIGATVNSVYCDATVKATSLSGAKKGYAGGIVGAAYTSGATFKDCVFVGEADSRGQYAAGILGAATSGNGNFSFKNCANYGTISARLKAGGITGLVQKHSGVVFDTCINAGIVKVTTEGTDKETGEPTYSKEAGILVGASYGDDAQKSDATVKDFVYVADICVNAIGESLGDRMVSFVSDTSSSFAVFTYTQTGDDGTVAAVEAPKKVDTIDALKGKTTNLTPAFDGWYFEDGQLPLPGGVAIAMGKASIGAIRAVSSQASAAKNDKFNLRFIATIDKLDYEEFGFEISYTLPGATEATVVKNVEKNVYTEIYGVTPEFDILTKKASDHNAEYLFTTTVSDLPATGTIVFTVKPYTKAANAEAELGVGYTVTYTDGAFVGAQALS